MRKQKKYIPILQVHNKLANSNITIMLASVMQYQWTSKVVTKKEATYDTAVKKSHTAN